MDSLPVKPTVKPTVMPVIADNVPMALRGFDRWVCWSWELRGKKYDKPPRNARTGDFASSTNATTWVSFDEALKAHQSGRFDGIGFTLGSSGASGVHFSGMDIDDCITEDDKIRPDAIYLMSMLDSYCEISPSGKGVKIFTCGPLLGEGRKKDDARGIEFYDSGRYFTVTGNRVDGFPVNVEYRSEQISDLRKTIFQPVLRDTVSEYSDRELALSCLQGMATARAEGYDQWLRIGMALFTVDSDLLGEWDDWSRNCSDKYTPGTCEKKWKTFKKGGLGLGSLIHWAKEDGWDYPPPKVRTRQKPADKPSSDKPKSESNGKHQKTERFEVPEPTNSDDHPDHSDDNDPTMGNGLTETDNAGPWRLRIELSNPRRYWLKSPIWDKSLDLKEVNGYILLTKDQLYNWQAIRRAALDQSGLYVMPDKTKKPVWDDRSGVRLLRRLLHIAERSTAPPDFDVILNAVEWIIEQCRRNGVMAEENKEQIVGSRSAILMEDGSMIYKLRPLAAFAKKESVGIKFEELREASKRYAKDYFPEANGKRHRYYRIGTEKALEIENELVRRGKISCV